MIGEKGEERWTWGIMATQFTERDETRRGNCLWVSRIFLERVEVFGLDTGDRVTREDQKGMWDFGMVKWQNHGISGHGAWPGG